MFLLQGTMTAGTSTGALPNAGRRAETVPLALERGLNPTALAGARLYAARQRLERALARDLFEQALR